MAGRLDDIAPPQIVEHGGIVVVRDDLVPGGTKARILPYVLGNTAAHEFVYASPVYGYAQIALAHTAKALGKRVTIFCAQRRILHARTCEASRSGARIVQVPHGYLSVVTRRAQDYCAVTGATLLPFGLDTPLVISLLAKVAAVLPIHPVEVWCVAGSGTLCRALQCAWPQVSVHAVRIGAVPQVGRALLHQAPERFEDDAKIRPPFPSCSNYDAKAWRFIRQYAKPGAVFWNVAA